MSLAILREFFNALGVTEAPAKPIGPPECGPEVWAQRMTRLATHLHGPGYSSYLPVERDRIKAMG